MVPKRGNVAYTALVLGRFSWGITYPEGPIETGYTPLKLNPLAHSIFMCSKKKMESAGNPLGLRAGATGVLVGVGGLGQGLLRRVPEGPGFFCIQLKNPI